MTSLWVSWSTGKDSAFALYQLMQNNDVEVTGIFTTVTKDYARVSMHAVRQALLQQQAIQLGLPLHVIEIPATCSNAIYEDAMHAFIQRATADNVTHMAFGDLFLEDIKRYRETRLSETSIKPCFPLWQENTHELALKMLALGMKAIVTCIDPRKLDVSFVGRSYDQSFLNDLPSDVDPCGEYGEFHTFVYDGPMFANAIPIHVGDIVERDSFIFADVTHSAIAAA